MSELNGTSANRSQHLTAVQKLRQLLAEKNKVIACPGVYDGFTARIALAEDFECLYMTGAGTTMSALGMADMGIATLNDMRTNAEMIANLNPDVPVIADADTGYGGAIMVGRTVTQYIRAGVAGLHLEDQVVTKRCGHLKGKQLVSQEEYVARIRAAAMAREKSHGDIVLIARTDALQSNGYDDAIARLKAAVAAGADVAFLEGLESRSQAESFIKELAPTPCLFNNVAGGVSPDFSVQDCQEIGYRIVIFPALAMEWVYPAVREACRQLKQQGSVGAPWQGKDGKEKDKRYSPKELFDVCGLSDAMEFDVKAGGTAYVNGA